MHKNYMRALPREWRAMAKVFVALGDEHRQRLLLTFEKGERLTVGQISQISTLSRPAVSHHLKILRAAGILEAEKAGKEVFLRVNKPLLEALLSLGVTPVITIPIADENGFAINSENDDIVTVLQEALAASHVLHLIEAPGLLDDRDDESTLIGRLTRAELAGREAAAEGRIKRKLLALTRLLDGGAAEVVIADGRREHPIADALAGMGTHVG